MSGGPEEHPARSQATRSCGGSSLAGLDEDERALDPLECMAHGQRPNIEIDVIPGEPEQLALAKAGADGRVFALRMLCICIGESRTGGTWPSPGCRWTPTMCV